MNSRIFILMALAFNADASNTTSVTVSGVLVDSPECTINTDNTINVNFGNNIITRKVDGINYKEKLPYTLVCEDPVSYAMTLSIRGEPADFDSSLISTNVKGLGIMLYYNGNQLPLSDSAVKFIYPAIPDIYAAPKAENPLELTAVPFTASATMMIDYQ